ncbi:MAG: sugar phosphate nucleotidyltransferase [Lautropia sp.]
MQRSAPRVLAFVLAGGEGKRLAPLTRSVAKPAVPFHRHHRLIDFALANLRNSGIQAIHVLTQYRPESVLEHLARTWGGSGSLYQGFVNPVVGGAHGIERFRGTADAVYCNRDQIVDFCPDVVAVFGADHVYRMDVRQMIDFHMAAGADATIAALPVPLAAARGFGVVAAAPDGRIKSFAEKPHDPEPMPGRPDYAFASMGNYLFQPAALLRALDDVRAAGGTDFGSDLLPHLLATSARLYAYDFATNVVPGSESSAEPHYWRDVGTLDAYFAAQMDTLGPRPRFDPRSTAWPIRSHADVSQPGAVGAIADWAADALRDYRSDLGGRAARSRLSETIVRDGVAIGDGAELSRCVLQDGVTIGSGCRLRNVIVDRDNAVPDGTEIGFDEAADRQRFSVSETGIVVVPAGTFPIVSVRRPARLIGRRATLPAQPAAALPSPRNDWLQPA